MLLPFVALPQTHSIPLTLQSPTARNYPIGSAHTHIIMRSTTFFPVFTLSLSLAPLLTHCLHNARTPALQRRQDIGSGPYELTNNENNQCTDVSCDAYAADEKASMRELTAEERSMYKRNDIAYENGANNGGNYNADGSPGIQDPQPVDPSQDEVYGPPQPQVEEIEPQPQQQQPQPQPQPQEQYDSTVPGVSGGGSVGPLQCQPLQSTDRCQFGTYTVERGDSCSAIGRRFSVPYLEIVRINNLSPDCQNLQPNSAMYVFFLIFLFNLFARIIFSITGFFFCLPIFAAKSSIIGNSYSSC